jgi:hypothetical protein
LYILSISYQIALINIKPFKNRIENIIEIINEHGVSIVLLFYLVGTDIVEDENIRYYAGYGIVATLIASIVLNLGFFFYNAFFIMKPKLVKYWNTYGCKKKSKTAVVAIIPETLKTREGSQITTHGSLLDEEPYMIPRLQTFIS